MREVHVHVLPLATSGVSLESDGGLSFLILQGLSFWHQRL